MQDKDKVRPLFLEEPNHYLFTVAAYLYRPDAGLSDVYASFAWHRCRILSGDIEADFLC
jgi:hypothetical protein